MAKQPGRTTLTAEWPRRQEARRTGPRVLGWWQGPKRNLSLQVVGHSSKPARSP